jgi:hypothetical protein
MIDNPAGADGIFGCEGFLSQSPRFGALRPFTSLAFDVVVSQRDKGDTSLEYPLKKGIGSSPSGPSEFLRVLWNWSSLAL